MGSSPSFPIVSLPRERTVVVTGGNTGIGYEAAKQIAMMGATVIIACRSEERALSAIKRMNEEYLADKSAGKLKEGHIQDDRLHVEFMKLDLASLKSTMEFIEAFKSSGRKLHLLLCNAGIGSVPRGYTVDGYELHFQVNYLSHFLIVAHLLSIMKTSGEDCRIVFTSSAAYQYSRFSLDDIQAKNPSDYGRFKYYAKSKLYQIQHMFSLSRRLRASNISVMSLHPGTVDTEIFKNMEDMKCLYGCFRCFRCLCLCAFRTPLEGAATLIDAAVNPQKKGLTGVYLVDCESASLSPDAMNEIYQEDLWKYSLECLEKYLPSHVITELEGTAEKNQP